MARKFTRPKYTTLRVPYKYDDADDDDDDDESMSYVRPLLQL